jgi:hypothetical protein
LADFQAEEKLKITPYVAEEQESPKKMKSAVERKLEISYTINLQLPATTEIAVFNAIFKSLKEHLLDE